LLASLTSSNTNIIECIKFTPPRSNKKGCTSYLKATSWTPSLFFKAPSLLCGVRIWLLHQESSGVPVVVPLVVALGLEAKISTHFLQHNFNAHGGLLFQQDISTHGNTSPPCQHISI